MAAAELYIDRGDGDENTFIYDQLHGQKAAIEKRVWRRTHVGTAGRETSLPHQSGAARQPLRPQPVARHDRLYDGGNGENGMENALKQPLAAINNKLRSREKAATLPSVSTEIAPVLLFDAGGYLGRGSRRLCPTGRAALTSTAAWSAPRAADGTEGRVRSH